MNAKKPRPRTDLNADTGKPDIIEEHPLITCTPYVMEGHAHLKINRVTVERVLLAELQHVRGPLALASGETLTEAQRQAVFRYTVAVMADISKLYAELGRLREMVQKGRP
jgi:uncharacterized protein (DUF433 family)